VNPSEFREDLWWW